MGKGPITCPPDGKTVILAEEDEATQILNVVAENIVSYKRKKKLNDETVSQIQRRQIKGNSAPGKTYPEV